LGEVGEGSRFWETLQKGKEMINNAIIKEGYGSKASYSGQGEGGSVDILGGGGVGLKDPFEILIWVDGPGHGKKVRGK